MNFTQIEFFLFLVGVIGFLLAVRNHTWRKRFLLLASYYFYAYWDWRFVGLIFVSTVIDFVLGRAIDRSSDPRRRKLYLIASLCANLGMLGFFKYCNFFIDSAAAVLEPFGIGAQNLDIILPIGISFYTFQTLSYTIDIYRRQLKPCESFWDFALFVAFFPQLVAGPIVRASEFLPQLETPRELSWTRTFLGFRQFVFGLTKKVLIADRLAMFVDGAFDNAGAMDGFTTWLAVLCYAVQIYCDFSGYSDMAIGVACMLGYDFCENFRHPYIATNITDFWRRWHISLSTWLRDYLYIPLGGNRKGATRTYINLFLTMLLGGLWHGAAWTFVVWGAIHGSALAAHKYLAPRLKIDPRRRFLNAAMRFAGWATTMLIVVVAWVPFRAADFNQARLMLRQMFYHFDGIAWYSPFAIAALAVMIVAHGIHRTQLARLVQLPAGKWYTPVVLFLLTWLVFSFQPREFQPFIYFQF